MNITKFRQDLQSGMTIEETCQKHHVTFQQAITVLHANHTRKLRSRNKTHEVVEHHIQRNNGYMVRKRINGKQTYFGRYKTMETAVIVRDYLDEHGWNKENLKRIQEKIR